MEKMRIEIWSDIACPFCYIGKRNFEEALAQFPQKEKVEVVRRSFQLAPNARYREGQSPSAALAEHLGISEERVVMMNEQVSNMAKTAGLTFDMPRLIWAGTRDAHRLIHFANEHGRSAETEELIFRAHFVEGKNISDSQVLSAIAAEAGLSYNEAGSALEAGHFDEAVSEDIEEFHRLDGRGVPFFVLDRALYANGARPVEDFADMLNSAYSEWSKNNTSQNNLADAQVCEPGKECN